VVESEIKIPVIELEPTRARLVTAGAKILTPAEKEVNVLFDTSTSELATGSRVLRIRRVGDRSILTFKGPAVWDGAVKQRREIELAVSSAETMAERLNALGYAPWMRYEKIRESWIFGQVRVELDHTPMGDFVELEGPPHDLPEAATSLGLDPDDAVRGSYISLWEAHRQHNPGLGRYMIFEP